MVELAILGALKERPMHGYELKKRLTYLLGHLWKISFGSLYPALKRLESKDAIEKAYTVKEKTRNRYVYRITPEGEDFFQRLLVDTQKSSEITDSDKFNVRLAFFQYMEPEMRLWLLEKRRNYLEEKLSEMRSMTKPRYKDSDSYRQGLYRHGQEIIQNDIAWLNGMIDQEKKYIQERKDGREPASKKEKGGESLVIEEKSLDGVTTLQA
ncbi:MAG: PadR family transcriptional regulator [Actinomycetota bacterium]